MGTDFKYYLELMAAMGIGVVFTLITIHAIILALPERFL